MPASHHGAPSQIPGQPVVFPGGCCCCWVKRVFHLNSHKVQVAIFFLSRRPRQNVRLTGEVEEEATEQFLFLFFFWSSGWRSRHLDADEASVDVLRGVCTRLLRGVFWEPAEEEEVVRRPNPEINLVSVTSAVHLRVSSHLKWVQTSRGAPCSPSRQLCWDVKLLMRFFLYFGMKPRYGFAILFFFFFITPFFTWRFKSDSYVVSIFFRYFTWLDEK